MIFAESDGETPLDPDESAGLRHKHINTRGELDELEQANIQQGLRRASRSKTGDVLDAIYLRKLHHELFGQVWTWAGTYRLTEKNIGIDPAQISQQLHMLLENTKWQIAHSVFQPLELAARFHHRLVQIHPFPNGNGRHARIATDRLLTTHLSHAPIVWASGTDIQKDAQRRVEYISALRKADAGDFAELLVFVGA